MAESASQVDRSEAGWAASMDFYSGVLGLSLVLAMGAQLQGGVAACAQAEPETAPRTRHFSFDMGNGNVLAFFWFPNRRPDAGRPDPALEPAADASAHHLVAEVPRESLPRAWARLEVKGVPFYFVAHGIEKLSGDREADAIAVDRAKSSERRRRIEAGEVVDTLQDVTDETYLASFYFSDPDGIKLELGAWCEPAFSRALGAHDEIRTRSGGRKLASLA